MTGLLAAHRAEDFAGARPAERVPRLAAADMHLNGHVSPIKPHGNFDRR